jgi:hypothetical protein
MQVVMAGFDHIDPANPCLGYPYPGYSCPGFGAALAHVWQKRQILTEQLCDFFENAGA